MRCHKWLFNADFSGFFSFQYPFPKPKSHVIRLTLSWKSGNLFSFGIKQWDKFKLDYSEQD